MITRLCRFELDCYIVVFSSTTSSTTSSSDTEFSKLDEQKLRDYIQTLKNDRAAVRMTVLELESVHIDPLTSEAGINPEAQRLDLENAVLTQELMAMKVKLFTENVIKINK